MSLATAVIRRLDAEGLVDYDPAGYGGDAFVARLPDVPDRAVMVSDTGGQPVEGGGTRPYDAPSVQIMIRGERREANGGHALASLVYDELHGLHATTLADAEGEIPVLNMLAQQTAPVGLGPDDKGRDRWTINLVARVHRPTRWRTR